MLSLRFIESWFLFLFCHICRHSRCEFERSLLHRVDAYKVLQAHLHKSGERTYSQDCARCTAKGGRWKAIVQMAQCAAQKFYSIQIALPCRVSQHAAQIHTTRQHKTQPVSPTIISSATFYFKRGACSSDVTSNYALRQTQKVICAFSHIARRRHLLFLRNHACAFEKIWLPER